MNWLWELCKEAAFWLCVVIAFGLLLFGGAYLAVQGERKQCELAMATASTPAESLRVATLKPECSHRSTGKAQP